ncbi:GGDEF domain-containing protein [Rhodococcoides fascians]|uniref:GGDEF domain-containing protein n=1 Tax=Rhodococcoides fascians TaxID=1828 RepID=UPI000A4B56D2|nr:MULTISPECIES: GGDEF domain-containing protein [Rhodococcus]
MTVVLGCVLAIVLLAGSNVLGQRISVLIDDVAQLAGGITATVVCWRTASRRTGSERQWRVLMAAGMACWSAGMAVWAFYRSALDMPLPNTSVADVGFFLFPIFAVPALLAFVGPSPRRAAAGTRHVWVMSLLDGAVVVGSLFVLSWATVLGAVVHSSESESIAFLVAIMYPITDLVLVAMIVLLAVIPKIASRYRTQLTLLGAGILMMAVSDSIYAYLVATGADFMPVLTDGGFIAGTALIALAAAAPRTVEDDPPVPPIHGSSLHGSATAARVYTETVTGERTQLLLPYGLMGAIGIVLAILRVQTGDLDSTVVVLGVAVVLLSLVRQVITLVQNDNLLRSLSLAQAELTYRAHHDGLTGLLNRSSFDEHLRAAVNDARAGRGRAVLLLIDLDDFKSVNDRFGHGGGDRLLVELARRLDRCVVDGVVARFGGDEFTALVNADLRTGRTTAVRIAEAMRTAHEIDGHSVSVGACVGVVQIGRPDRTADGTTTVAGTDTSDVDEDELMRLADRAMYKAKRSGKAGVYAYDTAGTLSMVPSGSDQGSLGINPKMVAGEPDPARLIGPPTRT